MKRTMYQAARHTPKRNVVSSSLAGGAKSTAASQYCWFAAAFYAFNAELPSTTRVIETQHDIKQKLLRSSTSYRQTHQSHISMSVAPSLKRRRMRHATNLSEDVQHDSCWRGMRLLR